MSMTYRPSEAVLKEIKLLKDKLGIKTNSKVLDHVLLNYKSECSRSKRLEKENYVLEKELYDIKLVLSNKGKADMYYKNLINNMTP